MRRRQTQLSSQRFRFLNVERELTSAADWNNPAWEKLWLYNLHYFDDLNAEYAESRVPWHVALIERWVLENPPAHGNGWEAYPLSLRIVNWIKWALVGNELPMEAVHSLAVQCRHLHKHLEYHLLGNHLFANAKALVFGGLFFEGPEAAGWLDTGLRILSGEVDEQILRDGGHFERSPMYHNIVLEDLLDVTNVLRACAAAIPEKSQQLARGWSRRAAAMLRVSLALAHPDGEIALLNDAAFGIAATFAQLAQYARELGIPAPDALDPFVHLEDTGYIALRAGPAWAVLDVGRIGPDYLPGHAHADTLSFELSIFDERIIVDTGTSCYAESAERLRQRSTSAHNTVEVDGQSSSEVWGSFRVARRAYPLALEVHVADTIQVRCAHDGYTRLRGGAVHHREWLFSGSRLVVTDRILNGTYKKALARFRFHPNCKLKAEAAGTGVISLVSGRALRWCVEHGSSRIVESTYHPEFGVSLPNKCLEIDLIESRARTRFEWVE